MISDAETNMKEKGRKHKRREQGALGREQKYFLNRLHALCPTPCAIGPDLSLTERWCTHAKIIFFRNLGYGL